MSTTDPEMARMLLWFKAQLPAHELTTWFIEGAPHREPIPIEGTLLTVSMRSKTAIRVQGYGECGRCGQRFPIPPFGNAVALNEERLPRVVEAMKEWVARDAERAGPCWGDVPPLRDRECVAVMDAGT